MHHGFIKAAAVTPKIRVADPFYNSAEICRLLDISLAEGAKIIVFPELCITGYTCSDLFFQESLLSGAGDALERIAAHTLGKDALVFVGLPVERAGKLYNTAAVLKDGEILAFIPKGQIPSYSEFYETRYFERGNEIPVLFPYRGKEIPFGMNILLAAKEMKGLVLAAEICEDIWVPDPPSTGHALNGATVIVNLSASSESVGKDAYRNMLVKATSARLMSAYIYASAGEGESSTDLVFGGHNIIAENGTLLAETKRFVPDIVYADLDIGRLLTERRRMNTFQARQEKNYMKIYFNTRKQETELTRYFHDAPFIPSDPKVKAERCEEILSIQSMGLKKRLEHTGMNHAVIGISGGLDSTLALLVAVRTFDAMALDRKNILGITMPCYGTTDRTYQNACGLVAALGADFREIRISEAIDRHFLDIGHDKDVHDVTYENSQARERTQILMDVANQINGLVIGTGDMSELALGFATYNGDHMSMYGVNSGVPKTLVRHLVRYYADTCSQDELRTLLLDVLDTPVSPELLPPKDGQIVQITEDVVGPYELHDFFLYYTLRYGYPPAKTYRIAKLAFAGVYGHDTILKWLKTFFRRFFSQQFKRSCLPDGPKVGSVALSPRGDLRMPSDASFELWSKELKALR